MQKGLFITFEGNDGCGKSTVLKYIANRLKEDGYQVLVTREPGGIEISEKIREVILDPNNTMMDAKCEALLYAASRRQHLVEKVKPALEKKMIVLCDRFIDSSLAYQGVARGLGIKEVYRINEFAISDTMPDLTILLKVDIKVGLARIEKRNERKDRLDSEGIKFHEAVSLGYDEVVKLYPERIKVVDANQNLKKVIDDTYQLINSKVKEND